MPVRVPERGRSATSPCQVYFNGSASCVSAFSTDHDHGGLPHSGSTQNGGLESPLDNKCHRDTFDSDQNEASNDGSFIYIDSSDSANWAGEADRKTCGARKSAESSNSSTPVRRRLDFSCLTVDSHPKHFGSPLEPVNVYASQRSSHDHLSMVTTQMHQESNTAAAEWRHKGSGHSRVSHIYRRSCIHLQGENTKPGGRMLLSARSPYTASLARPVTTKNLFSRTNPGPNPNSNPRHTIVQSKRSNKPQERKALSRRGKSHVPVEDSGTCGQRTKSTPVYHSNRTAGYNYGLPLHSPSAPKKKKKKPAGEQRISVCVRKRPLTQAEDTRRETDVVTTTQDGKCVMVHESKEAVDLTQYILQHTFYFDQVFGEESSNEEVYQRTAGPLVLHMLKGGKATCFAYGQTGAGKTHTMLGSSRRSPGLYALAARDIFTHLYATLVPSPLLVYVSFFEIYCRHLYDLLDHRKRLFARDDGKVFQIPGLREFRVETVDSLLEVISWGTEERTQGVSGLNPVSSRSHALLQIQLRSPKQQLAGRLWFVDLAGSERASDSRELDRQSRIEGAEINQSLLALKECIRSLDQKQSHTPFRQSKLTQVLKDSFVGNSKTCMIANISPGHLATEHTLNTLRYADRVKELRKQGSVRGGIRSKGTQTSGSSNGASTNSRDKSPTKRPKLTHRETLSPNTPTKRLPRGGPILSYSPKNSTAERSKGIRGREEEIGVVEHLIPVRCHRESLDPNTPTRRLPAAGTILCSTWRAGETAEKERHLRCYHQQLQQFTPLATSQSVRPSESPSLGISLSSFSNLLTTSASSSSTKPALSPAVYPGLQELLNVYGAGVEVRAGVIEGHHNHLPVRIYSSIESIGRHQNRSGEDDVDETGGLRGHCGVPANKAETRDLERGHESKEEEFGEAAGEEEARERGKQELCSNDSESWKPSDSNILFHHNQPRGDPPPNLAQAERPLSPACEPTDNHSTDVTLGDFFLESKDKHPSSSEFPPNGVSLVSTSEQESGRTGFAMKQHVSSSLPPPPRLLHAFTTQTRNEVPAGVSNRCPTTDPAFVSKAQISATEFLPSPEVYGHSVVKTSTSSPDESSLGSLSCVMDPLSLSQLQVDCQAATDSFLCGEKNNIPPRLQEYNEVEVTQTLMAQYYVELTEDVEGGAHLLWGMRKAKPAFQVVADGRFQELGDMKLVRTQLENKGLGTSVSPLKPHNSDTWSILHSSQHHQDASSQIISSQIQLECLQGTSNQTVPPISTSQSESNLNQLEMESRQSHSLGSYHSNYRLSPSVNETGNRQSLQESTSSQHIRPSIQSSPADLDHAKWCVAKAHLVQLQRMETLCHNEETLMHQQHEMAFGDYINCLEEIMERKARCIQSMRAQLQQYLKPSPSDHQNIRDPTNNVFG